MKADQNKDMQNLKTNDRIPDGQLNNQSSNDGQSDAGQGGARHHNPLVVLLVIFLFIFALNTLLSFLLQKSVTEITYSQFLSLVEGNYVSQALLTDSQVEIVISPDANLDEVKTILYPDGQPNDNLPSPAAGNVYVATLIEDEHLLDRFIAHHVNAEKTSANTQSSPLLDFITWWIVPMLLIYLVYYFLYKRISESMSGGAMGNSGGLFGIGKSKAREYDVQKDTGVRFSDVAGEDEAKESLMDLVDYLHNPDKYKEIGAVQPKGALLVGPPGTGKTLLARAVAGEAHVPFFSITGSEFVEMFVGVGASRVRDLFDQAEKSAPCIIFIDELDAIGKRRDEALGSNDEREQTLNQLLAEMDGFDSSKGILVLAATNRPEVLDKALLRPGRFDRRIIVDKPDLAGREAILKVHAAKVKMDNSVDFHEIALATSGATGADLANMINEGALLAVKEGRRAVTQSDLMESVEVVIAGKEKKDRVMSKNERRTVAYHEVGHALVSALQKNSQPVTKITIVPRTMGSLGYTMNVPEEERYLMTRDELLAQISTLLGGRGAEITQFGQVSTGAANDIERATALARQMVTQYGMTDKFGPMELERQQDKYLEGRLIPMSSQETEAEVDKQVLSILKQCQEKAIGLLRENTVSLGKIASYLLEKESITGEEFMNLLRKDKPDIKIVPKEG